MIKEFEKQIILTKKVNEIISEIKEYTEEISKCNECNLVDLKKIVEDDVREIVDYCINMGVAKEYIHIQIDDTKIEFRIMYNNNSDIYEWYIGRYESGISYAIFDGLFCVTNSFSNMKPIWKYGFLGHTNTESEIVQYICTNWKDIKNQIIVKISNDISKKNERLIKEANGKLDECVSKLIDSNNAKKEM